MEQFKFNILLSASVPQEKRSQRYQLDYKKIKYAQIKIEEAIISLARNIFANGGKLTFGGHPSISPLVSTVAGEFYENNINIDTDSKPVVIYQSEAFRKAIVKDVEHLRNIGFSKIEWTEAIGNEVYNPEIKDKPQCKKSLFHMRSKMINSDVDAMVCIGGMEGVEVEFNMFREIYPQAPVFLLPTTGGATALLAKEFINENNISIADNFEIFKPKTRETSSLKNQKYLEKVDYELVPYNFIMSDVIQKINDIKKNHN